MYTADTIPDRCFLNQFQSLQTENRNDILMRHRGIYSAYTTSHNSLYRAQKSKCKDFPTDDSIVAAWPNLCAAQLQHANNHLFSTRPRVVKFIQRSFLLAKRSGIARSFRHWSQ